MNETINYLAQGREIEIFNQAAQNGLPVLLKGPTGCGKTRFVEYMAQQLERPVYTIACHDDLTASDLVGRHLIGAAGTYWQDGPLTKAVREGAICYLDEVVEQGADRYTDSHTALDFSAKYHLNDNWMIYAEVANLGDEPEYYYSGNKSRLYQYDEFGITSTIGFQVTY